MFKNITVGSLKPQPVANKSTVDKSHSRPSALHSNPSLIRFLQKGNVFEVFPIPGGNLLKTTLDNRQSLEYKCRKGSCGLCRIQVISGIDLLEDVNEKERKLLSEDVECGFRLACQARIK